MSKLVTIEAYRFEELSSEAKGNFAYEMYDSPFDYEDNNGKLNCEYFIDWEEHFQIEFCDMNDYLFNNKGELINDLIKEERNANDTASPIKSGLWSDDVWDRFKVNNKGGE
jgi:hypothetical protein